MAGKLHRLNREFEQMYLQNGEKWKKLLLYLHTAKSC